MSYFEDVQAFHKDVLGNPDWFSDETILLQRMNFLNEEITELGDAMAANDYVAMADALADLVYVALGTADILQLPFDDIWKLVHDANMRKVKGETKRGNKFDAKKPAGWQSPEPFIQEAILRHADKLARDEAE
jgi:predicted HAD superfamily Cof-like phosphohydrolase